MAARSGDWQLSCTEIKQRGAHLLLSGQWSDCAFLVGTEPNQVLIKGHKLVLAMASPVFEAMFYGGMAERNDPILILDVQPDAFKSLLEYIYTDIIYISSFDKACELCYVAKKYMLPHLVKECTKYMWSDLSPKNACRAYEFAKLFEEPVLIKKCMQIICTNTKEVLLDSTFEEVELDTMITVFTMDHLNVDSELDLFEAAVRYANTQNKIQQMDAQSCSSVNIEDVEKDNGPEVEETSEKINEEEPSTSEGCRQSESKEVIPTKVDIETKQPVSLRSAMEKIRFLTLTAQQFAEGPARSTLIAESEAFAILMNILSPNTDVPMPADFSTSRELRKSILVNNVNINKPNDHLVNVMIMPRNSSAPYSAFVVAKGQLTVVVAESGPFPVDTPSPVMFDTHPCAEAEYSPCGIENHMLNDGSSKTYCIRTLHSVPCCDYANTGILDCTLTFKVDKNICLIGVQVPTQLYREDMDGGSVASSLAPTGSARTYCELLYAHLLDADGARLTYTHYTTRVPYHSLLDINFNRPIYIQKNKVYKVGIVFNKVGRYPLSKCANKVTTEYVSFNFGVGGPADSVHDGFIRSIIFNY